MTTLGEPPSCHGSRLPSLFMPARKKGNVARCAAESIQVDMTLWMSDTGQ